MKVLFLANLIPFPLDSGGKIFSYSTLKAVSQNNDVDLLCFYEKEDAQQGIRALQSYCGTINALPIRVTTRENMPIMMLRAIASVFSLLPLGISKYITHSMEELIQEKMADTKYDCVFLNLLAMYAYVPLLRKLDPQIKIILYEQNCEALIYKRYITQTSNPLKKTFLHMETKKLEKFEQRAIRGVDRLILLSREDQRALGVPDDRCTVIPIGVQPAKNQKVYQTGIHEKIKLLFVGTMTWMPNSEGIAWFLTNVMPLCADKNQYELYIVGKNPDDTVRTLCEKYENVHLMGYVESVDEYYEKCDTLIVPLFIGSGQRVKILEAFARGYAVVSTSIGAEGLKYEDGKTIMIANTAQEFKAQIDSCADQARLRRIGAGGKAVFDCEYSTDVIAKRLNEVLK